LALGAPPFALPALELPPLESLLAVLVGAEPPVLSLGGVLVGEPPVLGPVLSFGGLLAGVPVLGPVSSPAGLVLAVPALGPLVLGPLVLGPLVLGPLVLGPLVSGVPMLLLGVASAPSGSSGDVQATAIPVTTKQAQATLAGLESAR
jgi:hypothetical protein